MAGCNLPGCGGCLMLKERLVTPKGSPFSGTEQPAGDFL